MAPSAVRGVSCVPIFEWGSKGEDYMNVIIALYEIRSKFLRFFVKTRKRPESKTFRPFELREPQAGQAGFSVSPYLERLTASASPVAPDR